MEQHNGAMAKSTYNGAMQWCNGQWCNAMEQCTGAMAESTHNGRKCTQWQKVH